MVDNVSLALYIPSCSVLNCTVCHLNDSSVCIECDSGLSFNGTACVVIPTNTTSCPGTGCALCQINDTAQCLVCDGGYSLQGDSTCLVDPAPQAIRLRMNR